MLNNLLPKRESYHKQKNESEDVLKTDKDNKKI